MKIDSIVAVCGCSSGNFTVRGDGITAQVEMKPDQLSRMKELARTFYLENQKAMIESLVVIPPSNQLEAPAPEYTEFEPVREKHDDDLPF